MYHQKSFCRDYTQPITSSTYNAIAVVVLFMLNAGIRIDFRADAQANIFASISRERNIEKFLFKLHVSA